MLDRGTDPLPLAYTYTPSSNTVGLLLHLQYYQRCKSMLFKMRGIVNVLCDSRVIIIWWLQKKDKKIHVFGVLIFFEDILLLSILRKSLWTRSLDDILLGKFKLSNSIILVEDIIKWKRYFEIFFIDHRAGDIGNKIIAGKYQKIRASLSPTLY